ncbi:MAG: hypothetical protein ACLT3D_08490 [Lawsonibacter sp.]
MGIPEASRTVVSNIHRSGAQPRRGRALDHCRAVRAHAEGEASGLALKL